MTALSVLDLVSVREGGTVADALAETAALAKLAEDTGYKRFWIAEHHGTEAIAGGATAVVLAHVGHATSTIRIGAGGIMLPNHNPFVIAEQFGTLDALFPDRVDLGLGRAPGADSRIGHALRKDLMRSAEAFPQDVAELGALFAGDPRLPLQANPGKGARVEMWILGSSLFGAQLAAHLGLPYAFASHFAPAQLDQALHVYRSRFQPSAALEKPHVMVAMSAITAESDAEAELYASSWEQGLVAMRSGATGMRKFPPPVGGFRDGLRPEMVAMLDHMRQASAIGSRETVRAAIARFAERTGADEIVLSGMIFDPEARRRSLVLTMDAMR